MIDDRFRVYVEQLRDGQVEELAETISPEIMDVKEKDLAFADPIYIKGEAYLADHDLVLHLNISTVATIPCLICNEPVKVGVNVKGFYHAVPLEEIKGGVYDFQEIIRETILLETPFLAECNQGKCSQRKTVQKFLKDESSKKISKDDQEGYRPFADLDFDYEEK